MRSLAFFFIAAFALTAGSTASAAVPQITSAFELTAVQNQPFTYQITATDSPTSFGATGLPSGLSVNASTGLITGAITRTGTFFFDVSATNGEGAGSLTLALTVSAALQTQPTVTITSPPANITVISGSTVPLAASVDDPDDILAEVRFFLNGSLVTRATSAGPFVLNATAPAPGTYVLKATAIDSLGRQSESTRTVTVVAPDPENPVPSAEILTPLDGRALAAGSLVTITAAADPINLDHVDFYADGVIFATVDSAGNLITRGQTTASGERPTRRESPLSSGSTVFQAAFQLPNTSKLVNIFSVAISKLGQAQASKAITVQSVANVADRPPRVSFSGLTNQQRVRVGAKFTLPVVATDPDAGGASSASGAIRPVRRVFEASGVIKAVELFINGLQVKQAAAASVDVDFTPPAAGKYVLTAVATDNAGLSTVSDPITVIAGDTAVVNVAALGDGFAQEGGKKGKVLFSRASLDLSSDLTVFYQLKGTATNGKDYRGVDNQPLSTSIVIPAGSDSIKLKIQARDDNKTEGNERLNLVLLPSASGDYTIGDGKKAKLFIIDND